MYCSHTDSTVEAILLASVPDALAAKVARNKRSTERGVQRDLENDTDGFCDVPVGDRVAENGAAVDETCSDNGVGAAVGKFVACGREGAVVKGGLVVGAGVGIGVGGGMGIMVGAGTGGLKVGIGVTTIGLVTVGVSVTGGSVVGSSVDTNDNGEDVGLKVVDNDEEIDIVGESVGYQMGAGVADAGDAMVVGRTLGFGVGKSGGGHGSQADRPP